MLINQEILRFLYSKKINNFLHLQCIERKTVIKIKILFMGPLGELVGEREATVELPDQSKFRDLLNYAIKNFVPKFPKALYVNGEFRMILMLNQRDIHEQKDADRPLNDGDTLYFIPPIGGG
jgi:molybdopterin converting factor small subunit